MSASFCIVSYLSVNSGSSILATSSRLSSLLTSSHQQFPPIPANPEAFISTGVRQRPTFFGCNPQNNPPEFPLVIYFPNSPPINGADPVTKYVPLLLMSISLNNLPPTAPEHSKSSTPHSTAVSSSTKYTPTPSAATSQNPYLRIQTGAGACNVPPLTVQDTK